MTNEKAALCLDGRGDGNISQVIREKCNSATPDGKQQSIYRKLFCASILLKVESQRMRFYENLHQLWKHLLITNVILLELRTKNWDAADVFFHTCLPLNTSRANWSTFAVSRCKYSFHRNKTLSGYRGQSNTTKQTSLTI